MRIFALWLVLFVFGFCDTYKERGDYYYRRGDTFSAKDNYFYGCNHNEAEACYMLGYFYDNGLGARQNFEFAIKYYAKALSLGSQSSLNMFLSNCQNGSFGACKILGFKYEDDEDFSKAKFYYNKVCSVYNDAESCNKVKELEYKIRQIEREKQEQAERERRKRLEQERDERERWGRLEEQRKTYNQKQYNNRQSETSSSSSGGGATLILMFIVFLCVIYNILVNSEEENKNKSSAEEIFGKKNTNENFKNNQNFNNTSNDDNFDDDDEYKGFFTLNEAVYLVTILTKLMLSDGRVDKQEFAVIGGFIGFVANNEKEIDILIEVHIKALEGNVNVYALSSSYRKKFNPNKSEIRYIIFLFLHMVYADGEFSHDEKRVFNDIFRAFGVSDSEKENLYRIFWQIYGNEYAKRSRDDLDDESENFGANEPDPYEVLGVSKDASFDEIKRAYRKLQNRYHPDHLGANASDEEIANATKRAQEINAAYEKIKKEKGMK